MAQTQHEGHGCYRCRPHDVQGPFRSQDGGEGPLLESAETTLSEDGTEVVLFGGYSAREIAQKRARETGGQVYLNEISGNIRKRGATKAAEYAVATAPVYTLRAPDADHDRVYRAYWRPL